MKTLNSELNSRVEKINYYKILNKERLALQEKEMILKKENYLLEKEKLIYNKNLDALINDYNSINCRFYIISDLHYLSKLRETNNFLNSQVSEWTHKNKEEQYKIKFNEMEYLRNSRKLDEDLHMNSEFDNLDFKIKYYEEKILDIKISNINLLTYKLISYKKLEQEKMENNMDYAFGKYNLLLDRFKKLSEIAEYYDINLNEFDDDDSQTDRNINHSQLKRIFILEKIRESKLNNYICEKEKNEKAINKLKTDIEIKTKYFKHLK